MSWMLSQWLTGGVVDVSFEKSFVQAVLSACGLILCSKCPLRLASCYIIALVVLTEEGKQDL